MYRKISFNTIITSNDKDLWDVSLVSLIPKFDWLYMPGFTLHISKDGTFNPTQFQLQLNKLLYFPKYEQKFHLRKENLFIGSTTYKDYPFFEYRHGDYLILFEGHVYNSNFEDLIEKSIEFINKELSSA